jgi:hypothetical protein
MFVPVAIIMALALGAAATVYVDGGVNQEGFDYDLTCTEKATIHWYDEWQADHGQLAGGFYKKGAKVFTDEDCAGLSVKLVITGIQKFGDTDEHQVLAGPLWARLDDHGIAEFDFPNDIPVWKVRDVHVLIFTDCRVPVEDGDDCEKKD